MLCEVLIIGESDSFNDIEWAFVSECVWRDRRPFNRGQSQRIEKI